MLRLIHFFLKTLLINLCIFLHASKEGTSSQKFKKNPKAFGEASYAQQWSKMVNLKKKKRVVKRAVTYAGNFCPLWKLELKAYFVPSNLASGLSPGSKKWGQESKFGKKSHFFIGLFFVCKKIIFWTTFSFQQKTIFFSNNKILNPWKNG